MNGIDNSPTPFDDEESLYDTDENPWHPKDEDGNKDLRPCRDHECFYGHEPYDKWKLALKRNMFTCSLCGRMICDDCAWVKRRHMIHLRYFRNYSFEKPHGRAIDVDAVMAGRW